MPTQLGQQYSTSWRGKPPHMLATDIPVWYRFLDRFSSSIHALYYDCLLGGPATILWDPKDPLARMWHTLNSKRADAIAQTATHAWLIEVASHPGMRALGQLLTYNALWQQDRKINLPVQMILVAQQLDPDLEPLYPLHDISVHLV